MNTSSNQRIPPKVPSENSVSPRDSSANDDFCPLFDNAMYLMIEREESLLGEIVQECNDLMDNAREQAEEVADDIEFNL